MSLSVISLYCSPLFLETWSMGDLKLTDPAKYVALGIIFPKPPMLGLHAELYVGDGNLNTGSYV